MSVWKWLATTVHRSIAPPASAETSVELESNTPQKDNTCFSAFEFHNIFQRGNIIDWCEWHLNIDENDNAIKIVEKFHQDFRKLKFSSNLSDEINIIYETFIKCMPKTNEWDKIKENFKQARQNKKGDPLLIIQAYTETQQFSSCLNKDCAANTYHALKLYCTLLNCSILARTQEYTEAITKIFFHPQLDEYLVRKITVYRGITLEDKKLVENYKEGSTIITTTFLSTSTNPEIAETWSDDPLGNKLSIFCTYNIRNDRRRTALDLKKISRFAGEEEILILRYVPFTIRSITRMDDNRKMKLCFDECEEQLDV